MSIVFDARKHAEQSKRAREAVAETPKSPEPGPPKDPTNATSSNQESCHAAEARPHLRCAANPCSTISEAASVTPLGLRVERHTTDWRLRWNRDAVVNAARGRLSITDGAVRKQLDLDTSEMRNGSIVYTPTTDDVILRLEMEIAESTSPVVETIHVIGGAVPPGQLKKESKHGSSTERVCSTRIARSDAAWAGGTAMTHDTREKQAPLVRSVLRRPRSEQVADEECRTSSPIERGGKIEPATLVLRVDPAYPVSAEQSLISGSVELRFRISPEGRVYDVRTVRGSPILARAAIQAVEGWWYEPARLNGAPIDSQASTNFDFELN